MPEMPSTFDTIRDIFGPHEIKEKGSRFIAYLHPVKTSNEAAEVVLKYRRQYHDATHICYAYRLGQGTEDYFRVNDDGEPSGTAGIPILKEIQHCNYFNVLAVVVRYFGGTKLGTGGLARAYQYATRLVIEKSKAITKRITRSISLEFPFELQGDVHRLLGRFKVTNRGEYYSEEGVKIKMAVPLPVLKQFRQQIINVGKGKIVWQEE